MSSELVNWAGNLTFRARRVHRPTTLDELRAVVAGAPRVRALGTRHSFSDVADTTADLVSLAAMPPVVDVDAAARTVTVAAGARYAELARELDAAGFALPNLASLPHISVGGACATGTHGSGVRNTVLPGSVRRLELVTADGDLRTVERGDPDFPGLPVSLGAVGVFTTLTLDVEPTYDVHQTVYLGLPMRAALDHFPELVATAYSVCLFTDWSTPTFDQVWVIARTDEPAPKAPGEAWFTAQPATRDVHPVITNSAAACTTQRGVPGRWHTRLSHFRPEHTPSSGAELQSEYALPARHAVAALDALTGIAAEIRSVLQICEVRTVAADDLWLSPAYGHDTVTIHFTWIPDEAPVRAVIRLVERLLAPFGARPHWAKLTEAAPAEITSRYPRFADFRALVHRYDPAGKFGNPFTERYLGEGSA
ncbi:FAD-binding protein [Micromonospora sp. WMMD882]|uniref:D-arabinono-1,4-lactone oxidase n=1 Tax=Micromonospora sp. WMMD882 TaxID=3015151 RepID=UPI00248C80FD|nr:D-arabinono-1,4-lactone oxidase [Micromonospora sp. WMMD882]WBB78679.1 FAD-binding protein [Micromonospora sp. WMMD882]